MDFAKLRAVALRDGDDEEAVTVNTRALIDKVLARYSGEWTTLRELLQNAADAQASTVTIKFETLPSSQVPIANATNKSEVLKHILLNHTLKRLLVTNDGQEFGRNDWSRLKRIAEGNPDETKIGAFGVGFYSVFADCEEPFVSSGNEAMAFYWKGNSLFTRRLQLPPGEGNPHTSFVLDYRNTTTPIPNLLSVSQFLATSLTFVSLQNIELWIDDYKVTSLQKKTAPSIGLPIARDVETRTKDGLMKVQSLERESVQMDANFMNVIGWKPTIQPTSKPGFESNYGNSSSDVPSLRSFFSRLTSSSSHAQLKTKAMREEKAMQDVLLEDLTAKSTAHVFLRVTTAVIKTSITSSFASELERATKKPPPAVTKLAILTSSYDETTASLAVASIASKVDLFSSVLPSKKPGGRIFIGFPTHQTTGAGMHLSAPSVIPTVERESIDLNARWVRTWNVEMLRVAGIMARLAFANEMEDLSNKVKLATKNAGHGSKVTNYEIISYMPEAQHILATFTFKESTPSSQVTQIIEEAFWTAYKKPSIEIYSTRGILPTTQVRLATEDLSGFVDGIPVIPDDLSSSLFVMKLKDFGLITEITMSDVIQELRNKALTSTQLIQFIKWLGRKSYNGDIDWTVVHSLLDVAVATIGDENGSSNIIALGSIKSFLDVKKISADVPLPTTTIPFQFTQASSVVELQALGWVALEVVPWLTYLIESNHKRPIEQDLTKSVPFAAKVLLILSKSWDMISPESRDIISALLNPMSVIPTKLGMRRPGDAFFASVKLFDDLPIITSCPGVKEKFLAAIGVRKTVDLETIFNRLLNNPGTDAKGEQVTSTRHVELIRYLASVRDDIPADDLKRLKVTPICPAEAGPKGHEWSLSTPHYYKVSDLYEPRESLRDLNLNILQWPGPPGTYRPSSVDGRFLSLLGLRAFPSVGELIDLMTSDDGSLRERAMSYFISNHHINGYASTAAASFEKPKRGFLPLQGDSKRLVKPTECFTNEKCIVLGFNILKRELHPHANKFNVATDPPMIECVNRLISNPPTSHQEASTVFAYFSSRLHELESDYVMKLYDAPIVPISLHKLNANGSKNEKTESTTRQIAPRQCYLGESKEYGDIFDFVNFGQTANIFLLKCGSKEEPTIFELATLACQEPARLLGIMQSTEKYLMFLRKLANETSYLKRNKVLWKQMMSSKFLLGSIEITGSTKNEKSKLFSVKTDSDSEDIDDSPVKQFQLALSRNIAIVDDYNCYRLFKSSLICAPLEDTLEKFYIALGAPTLKSLVMEDLRVGENSKDQSLAFKRRSHIIERSKILLHETPSDKTKHDSRWLEKNLVVSVVSSISLRRSLRGSTVSSTEKRSAALGTDRKSGPTLYITSGKADYYQISLAICELLLDRPSQQSNLIFETLLNYNLLDLRSRGYNVERILRAKEAEAKIAEDDRQKQLAIEQQHIREREAQWRNENEVSKGLPQMPVEQDVTRRPDQAVMPGAFGADEPEEHTELAQKPRRGLFSNLTRRLGIDGGGEAQQQLQNFLGGGTNTNSTSERPPNYPDVPPPYAQSENAKPPEDGAEQVSSPHAVQQNLMNAIQSSRAHNSSTLFSPPKTNTIKEQATYCDSTPSHNLKFLAETSSGMRIFVTPEVNSSSNFLANNIKPLNIFSTILYDIADIYTLPRVALHIFFDEKGSTIAFNRDGSIFCNFRFFAQLHQKRMEGINQQDGRTEAASYWWVVIAHELAHNLVKEHNAEHSYYTEMLVAHYFSKMMSKVTTRITSVYPPTAPLNQPSLMD